MSKEKETKKETIQITPGQYAATRKITLQAVTKMIREKNSLPDVISITKFGRFYILEVANDFPLTKH